MHGVLNKEEIKLTKNEIDNEMMEIFRELNLSSKEWSDRFKDILDEYVFVDDSLLTEDAKKYKLKLIKFCIDNFCC